MPSLPPETDSEEDAEGTRGNACKCVLGALGDVRSLCENLVLFLIKKIFSSKLFSAKISMDQ